LRAELLAPSCDSCADQPGDLLPIDPAIEMHADPSLARHRAAEETVGVGADENGLAPGGALHHSDGRPSSLVCMAKILSRTRKVGTSQVSFSTAPKGEVTAAGAFATPRDRRQRQLGLDHAAGDRHPTGAKNGGDGWCAERHQRPQCRAREADILPSHSRHGAASSA
jgi:hypothetical protein